MLTRRILLTIPLFAITAFAHHSMTMYDMTRLVEYSGTVESFEPVNPHLHLTVRVEKNGRKSEFLAEGGAPKAISNLGWKPGALKKGEKVRILVYPMKDGSTSSGWIVTLFRQDGSILGVPPGGVPASR